MLERLGLSLKERKESIDLIAVYKVMKEVVKVDLNDLLVGVYMRHMVIATNQGTLNA